MHTKMYQENLKGTDPSERGQNYNVSLKISYENVDWIHLAQDM